jgi:hypothetical protein
MAVSIDDDLNTPNRLSTLIRAIVLSASFALLASSLGACDPVYVKYVVADPAMNSVHVETVNDTAGPLELVQRVARRWEMTRGANQPGYGDCFWHGGINVGARLLHDSLDVRIQAWPISLRHRADSLRRELKDSLGARYGASRVLFR